MPNAIHGSSFSKVAINFAGKNMQMIYVWPSNDVPAELSGLLEKQANSK